MADAVECDPDEVELLRSPPPEGFDPEASRKFLDLFREEEARSILLGYDYVGLPDNVELHDLMRWVTDPVTGDTAVHVAAAAENIEGFKVIARSFGRDWRPNEWYMTCIKAIFFLRNKAGDTVFHIAARAGRLGVVNAAWYWFLCLPQMNQLPDESGSDVYVPVDEDMPEPEDVNPLYIPECMMAIVLLARKNFAGRTPADEAIAAGHDNVAEWLRLVLDRLTLNGRKVIEGRMARMEELVDGRYDIDGHHIKLHQIPASKRLYMRIDPNGSVTWRDDAGREVATDDDGHPVLGFCTY